MPTTATIRIRTPILPQRAASIAGHHDGHCHPAFSMILIEPQPALADLSRGGAPASPPASFTSHTPPLFDWPPSARR